MTQEFDLTAEAELESADGERIEHLATKVRNASPEFDGSDSQDDVVRAVLSSYLSELSDTVQQQSELQERTRERLGLDDDAQLSGDESEHSDGTAGSQSPEEEKRDEIRNRILE